MFYNLWPPFFKSYAQPKNMNANFLMIANGMKILCSFLNKFENKLFSSFTEGGDGRKKSIIIFMKMGIRKRHFYNSTLAI